jgi:hypothetical protein
VTLPLDQDVNPDSGTGKSRRIYTHGTRIRFWNPLELCHTSSIPHILCLHVPFYVYTLVSKVCVSYTAASTCNVGWHALPYTRTRRQVWLGGEACYSAADGPVHACFRRVTNEWGRNHGVIGEVGPLQGVRIVRERCAPAWQGHGRDIPEPRAMKVLRENTCPTRLCRLKVWAELTMCS